MPRLIHHSHLFFYVCTTLLLLLLVVVSSSSTTFKVEATWSISYPGARSSLSEDLVGGTATTRVSLIFRHTHIKFSPSLQSDRDVFPGSCVSDRNDEPFGWNQYKHHTIRPLSITVNLGTISMTLWPRMGFSLINNVETVTCGPIPDKYIFAGNLSDADKKFSFLISPAASSSVDLYRELDFSSLIYYRMPLANLDIYPIEEQLHEAYLKQTGLKVHIVMRSGAWNLTMKATVAESIRCWSNSISSSATSCRDGFNLNITEKDLYVDYNSTPNVLTLYKSPEQLIADNFTISSQSNTDPWMKVSTTSLASIEGLELGFPNRKLGVVSDTNIFYIFNDGTTTTTSTSTTTTSTTTVTSTTTTTTTTIGPPQLIVSSDPFGVFSGKLQASDIRGGTAAASPITFTITLINDEFDIAAIPSTGPKFCPLLLACSSVMDLNQVNVTLQTNISDFHLSNGPQMYPLILHRTWFVKQVIPSSLTPLNFTIYSDPTSSSTTTSTTTTSLWIPTTVSSMTITWTSTGSPNNDNGNAPANAADDDGDGKVDSTIAFIVVPIAVVLLFAILFFIYRHRKQTEKERLQQEETELAEKLTRDSLQSAIDRHQIPRNDDQNDNNNNNNNNANGRSYSPPSSSAQEEQDEDTGAAMMRAMDQNLLQNQGGAQTKASTSGFERKSAIDAELLRNVNNLSQLRVQHNNNNDDDDDGDDNNSDFAETSSDDDDDGRPREQAHDDGRNVAVSMPLLPLSEAEKKKMKKKQERAAAEKNNKKRDDEDDDVDDTPPEITSNTVDL